MAVLSRAHRILRRSHCRCPDFDFLELTFLYVAVSKKKTKCEHEEDLEESMLELRKPFTEVLEDDDVMSKNVLDMQRDFFS